MIRTLFSILLLIAGPAFANHPGERLDEVMAKKEPAFEARDLSLGADLEVIEQNGELLRLSELGNQIVILSFVPLECGSPCAEQQAFLAAVQEQVNITPMMQMVTFISVHDSDTLIDASWDSSNWRLVTPSSGVTMSAADRFAELSKRDRAVPMVHVINSNGRHASIFHGVEFKKLNLILYINGLINNAHTPKPPTEKGWWERLINWF
jgi:hypothetical protein